MYEQTIKINGTEFVVVPKTEYERLRILARDADESSWPQFPAPDSRGYYPAVECARVSLARKVIRSRVEARMTQPELAALAGMRVTTLEKIESGKATPPAGAIARIEKALETTRLKRKPA